MVSKNIKFSIFQIQSFLILDNNSKKDIELPHMLVEIEDWEKIVSKMGIKKMMK